MSAIDVSWLNFYIPIFGFLFVFVVMFAILIKTKVLGDNPFTNSIVSFVFAIIFITFSPGIDLVEMILPWFVILMISLFFVLLIVAFSQKDMDKFMKPGLAWFFIGVLAIIFLVSSIIVFNPFLSPYLPGSDDSGGNESLLAIKNFIYGEKFLGAFLLLAIAVAVSWLITKKSG
jgi:purine-cytosine permease-like protein